MFVGDTGTEYGFLQVFPCIEGTARSIWRIDQYLSILRATRHIDYMGFKSMKQNGTLPRNAFAVLLTFAALTTVLTGLGEGDGARQPAAHEQIADSAVSNADTWTLIPLEGVKLTVDPAEDWISRARTTTIDLDGLRQRVLDEEDQPLVSLPLFADVSFIARTLQVNQPSEGRFTWVAELEGILGGHVIVSARGDVAHGMVNAPGHGLFEFHPMPLEPDADDEEGEAAADGYLIREIDANRLPPCAVGPQHGVQAPERQVLAGVGRQQQHAIGSEFFEGGTTAAGVDETLTLNVMVAYTTAARNAVGGTAAMLSFIDSTIAQTNMAFQNSMINLHAELVHTHEVTADESGSIITDLNRITGVNNGFMDEVHDLRAEHQADLVALLVTYSSEPCGVAWCMANPSVDFASLGFSATRIQCVPNLTFPHELGHNMGCHHDHQNSGGHCGSFSFSFGHRYFGNSGTQQRTILAYLPGQRITYFSNPEVNFDGQPTGVPIGSAGEAHNAQTINLNAPIVTSFADQFEPPPQPEPPANNECVDRIVVTDGITSFSNTDASTDGPDEPALCDYFDNTQIQKDVWYEYTTTCTGELTVGLCGSAFPTKLGIYEGTTCPTQPNSIAECDVISCPSNTFSEIIIPVAQGESFIIRIGGRIDQTGFGLLDISCEVVTPECPADLTGTGEVDIDDLFTLLSAWGPCPDCPEDLNGDDVVDTEDLFELLSVWGSCP